MYYVETLFQTFPDTLTWVLVEKVADRLTAERIKNEWQRLNPEAKYRVIPADDTRG